LKFEYDEIGDILYIRKVPPYSEQETEPLEYNVYARLNPSTREVESVEILFFTKWILKNTSMRNLAELFSTPLAA
ncbi:MAG TPA: hypothetical protein VG722_11620, partial [Tepidisphaeraceae bacterium]|nr:hypothetical protein [Tepidisphaeraceae bacterium]